MENRNGNLFPWSIRKTEVGYRFIYYLQSLEYFPKDFGRGHTHFYVPAHFIICHAHKIISASFRQYYSSTTLFYVVATFVGVVLMRACQGSVWGFQGGEAPLVGVLWG